MTSEAKITTPQQHRARAAWQIVQALDQSACDEFSKLCKKTASRILNSGLMPALAFLDAKKTDGQNAAVLGALNGQLAPECRFAFVIGEQTSLLGRLRDNADGVTLRRAQTEALAYLEWLARFAEGRKKEDQP